MICKQIVFMFTTLLDIKWHLFCACLSNRVVGLVNHLCDSSLSPLKQDTAATTTITTTSTTSTTTAATTTNDNDEKEKDVLAWKPETIFQSPY